MQIGLLSNFSQRKLARLLNRSPSTVSREIRRNRTVPGNELFERVLNGLIRQYLPKGTDLSVYSQKQLDAIAYELNIRPRKRFDFKCPIEDMTEVMAKQHEVPASIQ
ncbi:helix-turn-helix domain-containing protein [Azotobacter chroococcum subsp. isscasi]|nr:helix-turn-helix domain-containing protein [Azotobacter chroococcum subsp. isscasi]